MLAYEFRMQGKWKDVSPPMYPYRSISTIQGEVSSYPCSSWLDLLTEQESSQNTRLCYVLWSDMLLNLSIRCEWISAKTFIIHTGQSKERGFWIAAYSIESSSTSKVIEVNWDM